MWSQHRPQVSETVIISRSQEGLMGEVVVGVFDDNSYLLIGVLLSLLLVFIWCPFCEAPFRKKNPQFFPL
jgi:hypothetical protein